MKKLLVVIILFVAGELVYLWGIAVGVKAERNQTTRWLQKELCPECSQIIQSVIDHIEQQSHWQQNESV